MWQLAMLTNCSAKFPEETISIRVMAHTTFDSNPSDVGTYIYIYMCVDEEVGALHNNNDITEPFMNKYPISGVGSYEYHIWCIFFGHLTCVHLLTAEWH